MKKIIKLLSNFIPNKKKRHQFRDWFNKRNEVKAIKYINSEKGKEKLSEIKKEFPKVLSTNETLTEIIVNRKSVCRFGDGEFNLCLDNSKHNNIFQKRNKFLNKRLKEILNSNHENILVCISPFKGNWENEKLKEEYPYFMERYWLANWEIINKILKKIEYGNALISRSDVFFENKLEKIKKIWEKKDVVFVYSKKGRFEIDKRLFDNIKSYEELFIPPLNAFDSYNQILEESLNKSRKKLFLIAAGPTATVLAYDLALKGYQALDIGHLPNCYKEFLGEIVSPEMLSKVKK